MSCDDDPDLKLNEAEVSDLLTGVLGVWCPLVLFNHENKAVHGVFSLQL